MVHPWTGADPELSVTCHSKMNKRVVVEIDGEEDVSAVKRVDVEGAQVRVQAEHKGDAQTQLRSVLAALKPLSSTATFPAKCLQVARAEIAAILDAPFNVRKTLVLRAESGDGRTLGLILLLAAACATDGLSALQDERSTFDDALTIKTRNWISWAKRVRRSSLLLTKHSLSSWSAIRPSLFTDAEVHDEVETVVVENEGEMDTTTGSVVFECFQEHSDAVSIHSLDNDDLTCDCCGIFWVQCRLKFYRCQLCGLDLCALCEERRVNFK
jgi:hypothetical protein